MEGFIESLSHVLSDVAIDNRVILTFSNFGYVPFLMNFLKSVERLNLTNVVVVALDEQTHVQLNVDGVRNVLMYAKSDRVFDQSDSSFGTVQFIGICNEKPWLVNVILGLGYDVLWIDCDIVMFRDPFLAIDINPDVDFQFQSDDDDICAGFYWAKSNPRTILFMETILSYLNPLVDDQVGMRRFLADRNLAERVSDASTDHSLISKGIINYDHDQSSTIEKNRISYIVLDRALFPNGTAFFNVKLPQKLNIEPYLVHNNCIIGFVGKKDRFKLFDLWYLNDSNASQIEEPIEVEPIQIVNSHREIVTSLIYRNELLYSASHDKTFRTWSFDGILESTRYLNKRGGIWAMEFDSKNNRLYTVGHDRFVKSFDLSTWEEINSAKGHIGVINDICLHEHKGTDYLFTVSDDGDCRSWNIDTLEPVKTYKGHRSWVSAVKAKTFVLFTSSHDGTAIAWDITTGKVMQVYNDHSSWVRCLEICSTDDTNYQLATGSSDFTVKLWNVRQGKCLFTLNGHTGGISCLVFRNNILFSSSDDGSIRSWDISNGQCLAIYNTKSTGLISSLEVNNTHIFCGTTTHEIITFKIH